MTIVHLDTIDALMAQYAAGVLPEPARVLVAAHVEMQAGNRQCVLDYEAAAGEFLHNMEPVPLMARDVALNAIFERPADPSRERSQTGIRLPDALLPKAIYDFVGYEAEEIPWKNKLPGFKEHIVGKIDGCEVSFFWIRPGRAVPAHTHQGYELSLILDGAFSDARGRYGRGDISVADDSIDHRPVAENSRPCIGFAIVDAPLRLTGSLRQLLGDLIG